jgi:DNA-binding transcriptional regulator GbsR (MarR family)
MTDSQVLPQANDLAEQIGELVYSWGFKRIHGRMWTHLMLSERPLDASDFVRILDISKALVSISLRELQQFEFVQMAGKSARGTQLYRINTNFNEVVTAVLRERERKQVTLVQTAFQNLLSQTPAARTEAGLSNDSVAQLGDWIGTGSRVLDAFLRRDSAEGSLPLAAEASSVSAEDADAGLHVRDHRFETAI